MKTKVCNRCKKEKELSEFYNLKSSKDGLQPKCKQCCDEYYYKNRESKLKKNKIYRELNKEDIKKQKKTYRELNKESIAGSKKKYAEENRDRIAEYKRNWYFDNFDRLSEKSKEYYLNNREESLKYSKSYREENIVEINKQRKNYRLENKESISIRDREYKKSIAKYETYKDQLTVEESPIEGEVGELLCKCTHCDEYFPVTNGEVQNRVQAIKGNLTKGELRLYCSDDCKNSCDIHNAKNTPKSLRSAAKSVRCNQKTAKKILLQLQIDEFGYNFCDKCGNEFKPKDLIIHHNIPVADDLSEAENIAHYMLVCKDHHEHKGCLGNKYE